ncbi:MAG: UMP kinase [bacterium]
MRYSRVLLKLSGEMFGGEARKGLDFDIITKYAQEIKSVQEQGVQFTVVVGGGNFVRGRELKGIARATADYMGMLATVINALAFQEILEGIGVQTRVMTSLEIKSVAEPFIRRRAIRHLEKGRVVIIAGGTGNPFFSTDTAAALKAIELDCNILLKATKVDGVYCSDPNINPNALKYTQLSYKEVLEKNLGFMDSTAISLCMEHRMPIAVFSIKDYGNITKIISGQNIGTIIC